MERESIAKEFTKPVHLTPLATSGRIEPSPPYLSEAGDEAAEPVGAREIGHWEIG